MKLTSDQVKKVAMLAILPVNDSDLKKYSLELSQILDYIDQLNSVNTENVEPTFNVTGLENIMRADEIKDSLTQKAATSNSPSVKNSLFMTKGIFEDE